MDCIATASGKKLKLYQERCAEWSESIAVGSHAYTQEVKNRLGMSAIRRRIKEVGESGVYALCEEGESYKCNFDTEKEVLSPENTRLWKLRD